MKNPRIVSALIVLGIMFVVGLLGGAIGNAFGAGFLGSPMAHIQLPAENISPNPIVGDFHITNTMVTTWAAILVLILFSFFATRNLARVPGRLQSLLEIIVEFFVNLTESIAGPERGRRFFPLVTTMFLFIVTANWIGILPGFGSIGWIESAEKVIHHAEAKAEGRNEPVNLDDVKLHLFEGGGRVRILPLGSIDNVTTAHEWEEHPEEGKTAGLLVPYLRSANTDLNTTLALALIAIIMVQWWGISTLGVFGHLGKFINLRQGVIFFFLGLLEAVSEIARVISLSFRLFGNIFAGEVLLAAMAFLVPLVGLIPFLGLELFVGLIQAFIFAILTLVFASLATVSHGDHADEH